MLKSDAEGMVGRLQVPPEGAEEGFGIYNMCCKTEEVLEATGVKYEHDCFLAR